MTLRPISNTSDCVLYLEKPELEVIAPQGGIVDQALHMCSSKYTFGYLMTPRFAVLTLTFEVMTAICRLQPTNPVEEKMVRFLALQLSQVERVLDGKSATGIAAAA